VQDFVTNDGECPLDGCAFNKTKSQRSIEDCQAEAILPGHDEQLSPSDEEADEDEDDG
jgi:hypothetical protein